MNILVLHGSSRRGGNSDALVDRLLAGMTLSSDDLVGHFYAIDMDIAHCRGCGACASGPCPIDDDMRHVYPAFSRADIVVLAAPIFWGYMTSQLKTLFDRLEALASPRHFGSKDFVLLVTYRHYYGSMVEWMGRITRAFGSRLHVLTCRTYDAALDRDVPIAELPESLDAAHRLGREVSSQRQALVTRTP